MSGLSVRRSLLVGYASHYWRGMPLITGGVCLSLLVGYATHYWWGMPLTIGEVCLSLLVGYAAHYWSGMPLTIGRVCLSLLAGYAAHYWRGMPLITGGVCRSLLTGYASHYWSGMPLITGGVCLSLLVRYTSDSKMLTWLRITALKIKEALTSGCYLFTSALLLREAGLLAGDNWKDSLRLTDPQSGNWGDNRSTIPRPCDKSGQYHPTPLRQVGSIPRHCDKSGPSHATATSRVHEKPAFSFIPHHQIIFFNYVTSSVFHSKTHELFA